MYQTSYSSFYSPPQSPTAQLEELNRGRVQEQSAMRRSCLSASPKYDASYNRYNHSTPYAQGKRNDGFANPSFFSSNVFYDHEYGYVNDMPNDKLLSPVKNDRYRKTVSVETASTIRQEKDIQPQQGRNRRGSEEGNFSSNRIKNWVPRGREARNAEKKDDDVESQNTMRRSCLSADRQHGASYMRYSHSTPYAQGKRNGGFANPSYFSSNVFYDHEYGYVNDMPNDRLLSPVKNDRYRKDKVNDDVSERQERQQDYVDEDNYNTKKVSIRERNEDVRDDRSEASSTYSGAVCPKCLNKHLAGCRQTACFAEKNYDREQERRIAERNQLRAEEEDARRWAEKSRRIEEVKQIQEQLDAEYRSRLDSRRSPARETNTSLNNLFRNHDDNNQKRWEISQLFGPTLRDQIYIREQNKTREKWLNSQSYGTSLQVAGRSTNPYLDDPETHKYSLKNQMEEREYNKRIEREVEKREEQVAQEQRARRFDEVERRKKEAEWDQKKDLQRAYQTDIEIKKMQKEEASMKKSQEKFLIDQGYERQKRRQQEEEMKTKSMLFDYKQSLLNQQQKSSYRRQYEERKQQKGATSIDIGNKFKKMYPCRDCNLPYEKSYLTKL